MTKTEALNQFHEEYLKLTDRERDNFSKIALKLLNETFIVSDKDSDRADYLISKELIPSLRPYFAIMDYALDHDAERRVVYIKTEVSSNRVRLKKMETICALLMRSIAYDESRKASVISTISTTVGHIANEIIKTEIYPSFDGKSSEFKDALLALRRYKLIDFNGDLSLGSTIVVIYKTISLVIDSSSLVELQERLDSYKGVSKYEENKETEID